MTACDLPHDHYKGVIAEEGVGGEVAVGEFDEGIWRMAMGEAQCSEQCVAPALAALHQQCQNTLYRTLLIIQLVPSWHGNMAHCFFDR